MTGATDFLVHSIHLFHESRMDMAFGHTTVVLDNCVFFITHMIVTAKLWIHIFSVYIDISLDCLLK